MNTLLQQRLNFIRINHQKSFISMTLDQLLHLINVLNRRRQILITIFGN
jgi:hypothetical protein